METKTVTREQVMFLKFEIKRLAAIRKQRKEAARHNTSSYSKIVVNGIMDAIERGEIEKDRYYPNSMWGYENKPLYRELKQKWKAQTMDASEFNHGLEDVGYYVSASDILTAAYILYNKIRNKKRPHIVSERKSREYDSLVNKWMERLESIGQEAEDAY